MQRETIGVLGGKRMQPLPPIEQYTNGNVYSNNAFMMGGSANQIGGMKPD